MGKADQFCCACASCEVNLSLETHSSQSRAAVLTASLSVRSSMSLLFRSLPNLGTNVFSYYKFNLQNFLFVYLVATVLQCPVCLSTCNLPAPSIFTCGLLLSRQTFIPSSVVHHYLVPVFELGKMCKCIENATCYCMSALAPVPL